eukprot:TRINITY_DN64_c0_g2_i5.p2 TRINITY_DN64_c0_g2~~TRINITY_DN64_c0_g2_i5.p2  ORF type:complete len:147 (-),score=17.03 TRINITY_DN64_c0_g2_i5:82-522(-)
MYLEWRSNDNVYVFNAQTFRVLTQWQAHTHINAILSMGPEIWTCGNDCYVAIWDKFNFSQIKKFNGHSDNITKMEVINMSGDYYVWTCSLDKTIKIWDPKTKKSVQELIDHRGSVNCILDRGQGVVVTVSRKERCAIFWRYYGNAP